MNNMQNWRTLWTTTHQCTRPPLESMQPITFVNPYLSIWSHSFCFCYLLRHLGSFIFSLPFSSFLFFWPNPFSFTPLPFLDNVQSCLDLYCKEGKSWPCHGGSGIHEGYEFPRKNHVVVDVFCNLIMPSLSFMGNSLALDDYSSLNIFLQKIYILKFWILYIIFSIL